MSWARRFIRSSSGGRRVRSHVARACGLALLTLVGGCTAPGRTAEGGPDGLPPYLVRMRQFYPELQSGRFVALAHFENPEQAKLARVVDARGETALHTQPEISVIRARDETGSGGLHAYLVEPSEALRLDAARSERLALLRDWSPYTVLLFSLHGPPNGQELRFTLHSGANGSAQTFSRTLTLAPGWQTFRIDLAAVAPHVDLTDVRYLAWQPIAAHAGQLDIYLDDVILADNTRFLLDESDAAGTLYVFERGRSVHVGTRGRFELAFRDGLISGWYPQATPAEAPAERNPTSIEFAQAAPLDDSETLPQVNLAPPSGLGPFPVPLPIDWATRVAQLPAYNDPALFAAWGPAVAADQRVVELSPSRVVIQARWRFHADAAPAGDASESPHHTWQYVVYPSGAVFIAVSSDSAGRGWTAERVGYALVVPGRVGFRWQAAAARAPCPAALLSRPEQAADVLWVPHEPKLAADVAALSSSADHQRALFAGTVAADSLVETAHLLRVWPHDIQGVPEAESFACDYQQPAALDIAWGRRHTAQPGDFDADGYNEAEGCYELVLVDERARFSLPAEVMRHDVRVRLQDTRGVDCWIYVDGRRIETLSRDRDGNVIFAVPGVTHRTLNVEIHARTRDTPQNTASAGGAP